jgi:hypothetical protein
VRYSLLIAAAATLSSIAIGRDRPPINPNRLDCRPSAEGLPVLAMSCLRWQETRRRGPRCEVVRDCLLWRELAGRPHEASRRIHFAPRFPR